MQQDEILFTEFFNQRLKERGYTLKHLSETTGIAMKHLENFAHGRFENLPSAPYVHGYFIKLAPLLGFEPDEWWNRIKEEDTVHRSGSRDRMPGKRFNRIRGRVFVWSAVMLVLVGIYIAARFTTIIGQPAIVLTSPPPQAAQSSTSVSNSTLIFEGRVRNGDSLTINGASVTLGSDGSFSTEVTLRPGPNTIEFRAKKFLGREVTITRDVYYDDSQIVAPAPEETL